MSNFGTDASNHCEGWNILDVKLISSLLDSIKGTSSHFTPLVEISQECRGFLHGFFPVCPGLEKTSRIDLTSQRGPPLNARL